MSTLNVPNRRDWSTYWLKPDAQLLKSMRLEAGRLVAGLTRFAHFGPEDVVLDFGAGTGHAAQLMAGIAKRTLAYDKSPFMRDLIRKTCNASPSFQVVDDLAATSNPEDVTLVVVHSVTQYMNVGDIEALFAAARSWGNPSIRLVFSDVLPEAYSPLRDLLSYLLAAIRHGFFFAFASQALVRACRRSDSATGVATLQRYSPDRFLTLAGRYGFSGAVLPRNLGYSNVRYSLMLTRTAKLLV